MRERLIPRSLAAKLIGNPIKVVMTGSASDPLEWRQHIRNKKRREDMALRFRDPRDKFQIVIVRDMWLTGFDAPSLHAMYIDKPMRNHGLMQAIARVNRVFKDKPGGLVVDYLGLADELRTALATYTESGGTGKTALDQAEAVAVMLEKYEICHGLFHGLDFSAWITGMPQDRLSLLPAAQEHILAQEDGKAWLLRWSSSRSRIRIRHARFNIPNAITTRVLLHPTEAMGRPVFPVRKRRLQAPNRAQNEQFRGRAARSGQWLQSATILS